jgi:hypothetical protein
MLHQGRWGDQQIVSPEWVWDATRFQKKTGQGDNYGYGWWVPPADQFVEFAAEGRGGQYIRVIPQLNMVIVTTGGGFEWNEITPLLIPAMINMAEPIPANQAAVEQLHTALAAIQQPPSPQAVPPLPEAAYEISGKTYAFEFSPLDLKTIRWEFTEGKEATLFATFYNQPDRELLIGMDGVYRMYPIGEHDLPMGLRCKWTGPQTLLFEYDTIANHDVYTLELNFQGDIVTIRAKERTRTGVFTIEGKQKP